MQLSLRSGEKIYVNGAVLKVDRKVSIQLLNDVTFMLESHVMQAPDANTPLKQLYFVVQTMVLDPTNSAATLPLFRQQMRALLDAFETPTVVAGLRVIERLVDARRHFEALKAIRGLFPLEAAILASGREPPSARAPVQPQEDLVPCK